jgi:hypothetical protein
LAIGAGAVLSAYVALALWYLASDAYADLVEPAVSAISWLVRLGDSPYHGVDAPTRYAHIYGPVLFLTHAGAFRLFGAGIWVSKLAGVAAALLSVLCLWLALRKVRGAHSATSWTAASVLVYMMFGNMSFWTRAEPMLLLCAAGGLLCALDRRRGVAIIGTGVAMGIAANLKITGFCYLVPVLFIVAARYGCRPILWSSAIAGVAMWLPFAGWSDASTGSKSAAEYWFWLQQSSEHGVRVRLLRPNIEWALYLAVPLGFAIFVGGRLAHRFAVAAALAAASLIIVLAAKAGAGPHHLLPFVPVIMWLGSSLAAQDADSRRPSWQPAAVASWVVTALLVAGPQQAVFVHTMLSAGAMHVARDLTAFADAHPGARMQIGYGGASGYRGSAGLTYYRPLLVFRSGTYLVDASAVQDHQLAGIEIPRATLEALSRCEVSFWLIPRGEEPFATRNMYPATGHTPLFSDRFKRTFREAYRLNTRTDYFDVYGCVEPDEDAAK